MGMPFPRLGAWLDELGVGAKHASRVFRGLHRSGLTVDRIPDLGRHAATILAAADVATAEVVQVVEAEDSTSRLVLRLSDGTRVEAVVVPMSRGRSTLCVSSQVGCAMACSFCATGTLGLSRAMQAGEIVAQIHAGRAWAAARGRPVRRLVFMGMGEPLHHYDQTAAALRVIGDPHGACIGSKQIMVSTVGLVPRMRQFSEDFGGRVQLALSLHAGTDATRRRIVPAAARYDLASLKAALIDHPLPGSRYLMLEYVVLPGVNDSPEEMAGVAAFTDGLEAVVNLIPFNPFPGSGFRSPTEAEVLACHRELRDRGVLATVRWPRGREAAGACGQLALRSA